MSPSRKTVYFLCSPSLGILDNWLPIINELKEKNKELYFSCIIPKSGTAELINSNSVVIKISENLFDEVVFKSHYGNWIKANSFKEARDFNFLSNSSNFIKKVYLKLKSFSRIKRLLLLFPLFLKRLEILLRKQNIIESINCDINNSVLLYDVSEEVKVYVKDILEEFKTVKKFSICHGININTDPIIKKDVLDRKSGEVLAYLFSDAETNYYKGSFSLKSEEIKTIGIPRHRKDWVNKVITSSTIETDWKNYVFLISRPASSYLPRERKRQFLEYIKEVVIDTKKLRVIVKRHPKERDEGLFEEVLGKNNQGVTWDISQAHPFRIGKDAFFSISFYSGVPLDMTFLGVPNIEILNLSGLKDYDTEKSCRDINGEPVLSYRYLNLVLGASDKNSFIKHVDNIINDRTHVINSLKEKYNNYFKYSDRGIEISTNDILKCL